MGSGLASDSSITPGNGSVGGGGGGGGDSVCSLSDLSPAVTESGRLKCRHSERLVK